MSGELIRRGEVMARLGCGKGTLRRLIAAKRLVPRRWHEKGRALFLRSDVDRVSEEMRRHGEDFQTNQN